MAAVSRVSDAVFDHGDRRNLKQPAGVRRKIWRILESVGKYAVDSAFNVSPKSIKGRVELYKTAHEELKDQLPLKPCNDKEKLNATSIEEEMQAKIDKIKEEDNIVKYKTSSEKMEAVSSKKLPQPEAPVAKEILLPNKRRIMIRSRL